MMKLVEDGSGRGELMRKGDRMLRRFAIKSGDTRE